MKKFLVVLLLIPVLAFTQSKAKEFMITGKITGLANGDEVKLINDADKSEFGKVKVAQGQFIMKGSVSEPGPYSIVYKTLAPFEFFLENGKITITGDIKDIEKLKVTGSASQKDFAEFKAKIDPLMRQQNAAASTINSMQPSADRDGLIKIYMGIQENLKKEVERFVTQRPHSYVSPLVLLITNQFYDDVPMIEKCYNLLDKTVRNSKMGLTLNNFITYTQVGTVGSTAIDFTQPDTSGAPVSLSSFRGKYVLVDFWASWCGPCRYENPNVVENFKKFKNKNFTILSVSLDKPGQKDKWIEAIQNDNLTWTHVSDLQFWNNAAAQLYHIQSIPQNILVDPEGKIVAKNLRGPDLNNKLCEIFGCN